MSILASPPRKVLIVDDDPAFRAFVAEAILATETVTIHEAPNGREGLACASAEPFDAIFLDYKLGDMDGLAVLAALRARGVRSPVIFCTGAGNEQVAVQAMKGGAMDYVNKERLTELRTQRTLRNVLHTAHLQDRLDTAERLGVVACLASTALEGVTHGVDTVLIGSQDATGLSPIFETAIEGLYATIDAATVLKTLVNEDLGAEPVDVGEMVRTAVGQVTTKKVRVVVEAPPGITAPMNEAAVRQAILHVFNNAVESAPRDGVVTVIVASDQADAIVTVRDDGPGFRDEPSLAAELFYSTKPGHEGLGLALARQVALKHGGSLAAANEAGGGAAVVLRFPFTLPRGSDGSGASPQTEAPA